MASLGSLRIGLRYYQDSLAIYTGQKHLFNGLVIYVSNMKVKRMFLMFKYILYVQKRNT